jgi:transcription antitermination factor NusG
MRAQFKPDDRQFKDGDKIRVNLHPGEIEDAVVKAVIQEADSIKLQVDVVGLDVGAD